MAKRRRLFAPKLLKSTTPSSPTPPAASRNARNRQNRGRASAKQAVNRPEVPPHKHDVTLVDDPEAGGPSTSLHVELTERGVPP